MLCILLFIGAFLCLSIFSTRLSHALMAPSTILPTPFPQTTLLTHLPCAFYQRFCCVFHAQSFRRVCHVQRSWQYCCTWRYHFWVRLQIALVPDTRFTLISLCKKVLAPSFVDLMPDGHDTRNIYSSHHSTLSTLHDQCSCCVSSLYPHSPPPSWEATTFPQTQAYFYCTSKSSNDGWDCCHNCRCWLRNATAFFVLSPCQTPLQFLDQSQHHVTFQHSQRLFEQVYSVRW